MVTTTLEMSILKRLGCQNRRFTTSQLAWNWIQILCRTETRQVGLRDETWGI